MTKKPVVVLAVVLLLCTLAPIVPTRPALAWIYSSDYEDSTWEMFGPRADKLLINLYFDAETEWDSLEAGQIDVTDWPLTEEHYNRFTTSPQDETVKVVDYGPEYRFFMLDINNNNNEYLGNPQDPALPNPVYPNPCSDLNFRQAIAHLIDKPSWLPTIIGTGFYEDLYTIVPPSYGAYSLALANPYPYNTTTAQALLDSGGFIFDDGTGHRFWDRNSNTIYDGGDEELAIIFATRSDHYHRDAFADALETEMEAVGLRTECLHKPSTMAFGDVIGDKNFHLYTGEWNLGVNPNYLVNWDWEYSYWHPGYAPNYCGINNPTFSGYALAMEFANTETEAQVHCLQAQQAFADNCLSIPLWQYYGLKAMRRSYTGGTNGVPIGDGEDKYRGNSWNITVNSQGFGIDNRWSFMNMFASGAANDTGDGENMVIRWGSSVDGNFRYLNPVYARRQCDWDVLNQIYEPLLIRDPSDPLHLLPWLAEDYNVSIYDHPVYGESTKIGFTMHSNVTWTDSTNVTAADVYFTFVELKQLLEERGLPPPSWYKNIANVLSFNVLDYYNFEVLFDGISVWAVENVGLNIILPRHIWKPIIESFSMVDVLGPWPDQNLIGCGPWRLQEYIPGSHILMVTNMPNRAIDTNLGPFSRPILSEKGYFQTWPLLQGLWLRMSPDSKTRRFDWEDLTFFINATFEGLAEQPWAFTLLSHTPKVELKLVTPSSTIGWLQVHPIAPDNIFQTFCSNTENLTDFCENPGIYKLSLRLYYEWETQIFYFWYKTIRTPYLVATYDFIYGTLKFDIVGGGFISGLTVASKSAVSIAAANGDDVLPIIDGKVDIKDVAIAAKAFGSYPGHERWSTVADTNDDYKIDIKDIAGIAKWFGWVG